MGSASSCATQMAAAAILSLLLMVERTSTLSSSDFSHGLSSAITALGWRQVTVVVDAGGGDQGLMQSLAKALYSNLIQVAFEGGIQACPKNGDHESQSNCVIFLGENVRGSDLAGLKSHSVLMVPRDLADLEPALDGILIPFSALVTTREMVSVQPTMFRVLTQRGEHKSKKCEVRLTGSQFQPRSCLLSGLGTSLEASSLPYTFQAKFNDCQLDPQRGMEVCHSEGLYVDVMSLVARMHNFTLVSYREPTGKWGEVHSYLEAQAENKSGSQELGILGRIIQRDVDTSLVGWVQTLNRQKYFDFTHAVHTGYLRCYGTRSSQQFSDRSFLISPLSRWSWILTGLLSLFLIVAYFGVQQIPVHASGDSLKLLSLCMGILFVLLSSMYGGALTMMLASHPRPPFQTFEEGFVIAEQDSGININFIKGAAYYIFKLLLDMRDPIIQKASEKYLSEEYETKQVEMEETVAYMDEHPGTILMEVDDKLGHHLSQSTKTAELFKFCRPIKSPLHLLLSKNSPFTPAIKSGIQALRERGNMAQLKRKWMKEVKSFTPTVADVRSIDLVQLGPLFVLASVSSLSCILILGLEAIIFKCMHALHNNFE